MIEDLVDHNQSINGHSITVGWLLDSLRKNDKEFQGKHGGRKVKEILIDDVSNGNGIISNIFRCTLSFTDSIDPKDIYTTILKIPGTAVFMKTVSDNEMTAEMTKQFVEVHSAECNFYNNLAPIFDVPIPKVYQTLEWIIGKHDGCIHMEDLTKKGKVLAFYEDINLTQIKNVIKHLAHMHKNVLTMDSKIWEGKYPSNPDGLNHFIDMLVPTIDAFKEKCKRKDAFNSIFKKLDHLIRNKDFYQYGLSKINEDIKLKKIIVHGDLHLGNIVWAVNNHGEIKNEVAAIIDWQIMYEGSPMNDLARFLSMCASGIVRRQAEIFAIDFYLECLTKEFDGDSSKVPYTREELQISYNYVFICHILFLISGGILLVNVEKDEEKFREACWDKIEQKILMACEDAIKLLDGEMKDLFKKFGDK